MAKKLKIQVEFESVRESLSKMGAELDKAFSSKIKLFTPEQQKEAQALKALIADTTDRYSKAVSSGKMTKQMMTMFKETFDRIANESKRLGADLNKNVKMDPSSFFTSEQVKQVEELNQEIQTLKNHLIELKKKKTDLNFQDIFQQTQKSDAFKKAPGSADFRLGTLHNTKDLDKAEEDLLKRIKQYDELKYRKNDDPEKIAAKEKLELHKLILAEVQKAKKEQIAAENAVQEEILQTNLAIKNKADAIDNVGNEATKEAKDIANNMKTQGDLVKDQLGGMKWKEAMGLEGGLDVFGGFVEGVTGKVKGFVTGITSGVLILNTMRRVFNDTIKTIRDLDQAFNNIAIVTTYTTEEVWEMKDAFVGIADTAGMSVIQITNIANEFFRQGRSLSETLKLTEAAGIAAKVAGIDATKSVDYLTSAINGYKLSANQAMAVSDKFAALAAGSATDYEELAIALSKVAAQAYSAGVNMDNMMGFIAKALETTREAPENIGTAFKTIFARMSELKDYGKTLEDGMDVNRIDKALKSIGVNLTDQTNELRNLDEVLIDVGYKWTSLTKNQKAYVTTALAGTRQQTRLLAIFEDFDRTMELTEMSANSLGATFAQQEKYYKSIAYAQNQLTVAWQNFVSSLGSSSVFIGVFNLLSGGVNILNNLNTNFKELGPIISSIILGFAILAVSITAYNLSLKKGIAIQIMSLGLSKERTKAIIAETTANLTLSASFGALTKSIIGFISAAFGAYLPLTIFVAALGGLVYYTVKAINKNKDFVKSMRTTQSELFNLRQEAQELEGLIEEYEDIELKVRVSDADLSRQEELIKQIQDLVGEDVQLFNLEGEFDIEKAKIALTSTQEQAKDKFNELKTTAIEAYGTLQEAFSETTDEQTREAIILQKIIEDGDAKSYDNFLTFEKKKREELKKTAELALILGSKTEKTVIEYNTPGMEFVADEYIEKRKKEYKKQGLEDAEAYKNALADASRDGYIKYYVEIELDETEAENASRIAKELFKNNFEELSIDDQLGLLIKNQYSEWGEDVKNTISKVIPSIKGLQSLMDQLGAKSIEEVQKFIKESGRTSEEVYKLNEVISSLDIEDKNKKSLFEDLLESGTNTFQGLQNYINEYNVGFFKAIELTQQLKDALTEVSFEKISDSIASIRSVDENLSKVNAMLSGEEAYDISFMREMIELYPEIGNAIRANTELSQESIKTIMDGEQAALETSIDNQIASLETDIANNELKIAAYTDMLTVQAELQAIAAKEGKTLEQMTMQEIEDLYDKHLNSKIGKASEANTTIAKNNLQAQLDYGQITQEQFNKSMALVQQHAAEVAAVVNNSFNDTTNQPAVETFSTKIQTAIDQLKANNQTLRDQISNLEFLKTNIDKVTASTNAATEASEKYKAALDEIYILTQQLSVLEQELSRLEFMEEHAKTGEEYLTSIYSQNAALKAQISVTEDLIDAQKRSQDGIYESLGNLQGSVQLINGRLVPIMSKYINLGEEQQKLIDESVESYNDLSEGIGDNSQALLENAAAIEENLQKIEDKTVEFYDILKDAIIAEEDEKLQILKDGLEEERKLLNKRKEMYEDAFSETDYLDALKETTDKRAKVIEELAALEGATDLNSQKRRQELLKEKAELDKEYNSTTVDYNKDALFETIDKQQQIIDEVEAKYQAAYEERVNSVAWMEARIQEIIQSGDEATIQYLKDNLPKYQDAWTITRDNIEDEWRFLYGVVDETIQNIENSIPDFSDMIAQLREAARLVGQIRTNESSSYKDDGGDKNTGGKTKTVWMYNGKQYSSQGAANDQKEEDVFPISNEVTRLRTALNNTKSYAQAVALGAELEKQRALLNQVSTRPITSKVVSAKTGGLVDYTGMAMLHGSSAKPERVLSSVQTELFDRMVEYLGKLSNPTMTTTPVGPISSANASVSIDNVQIAVNGLQTDDDFTKVGDAFGDQLKAAIKERGLNINKKR